MNEFTTEDYKKFKQEKNLKVHGWFMFGKPALSINDVDIIKQIQVPILYKTPVIPGPAVIPVIAVIHAILKLFQSSLKLICFRSKTSIPLSTETRRTLQGVS